MRRDVVEMVNRRIFGMLEKGVVPWRMPWTRLGPPRNLVSGKAYRGINLLLLSHHPFATPWFLTPHQANRLGGSVRPGAEPTPVVFWAWVEPREPLKGKDCRGGGYPVLRCYTVYNVEQCEGVEAGELPAQKAPLSPVAEAERLFSGMPSPPVLSHRGDSAFYCPESDEVVLPPRGRFSSAEEYHSTLFHELVHATGHPSRLDRKGIAEAQGFGSESYSREELIAEMGAAYLCALAGISPHTEGNSAAYIGGWLARLRQDRRLLLTASAAAQKAVEYIRGREGEK